MIGEDALIVSFIYINDKFLLSVISLTFRNILRSVQDRNGFMKYRLSIQLVLTRRYHTSHW